MSRKKLPHEERKVKLSISIDRLLIKEVEGFINNKSKYIESLIFEDLKKKKYEK